MKPYSVCYSSRTICLITLYELSFYQMLIVVAIGNAKCNIQIRES